MLTTLRTWLSRVDERPVAEIDRDIDDELACHIAELEADLVAAGLPMEQARAQAVFRFGKPDIHKRRCRDIALLERRMKTTAQMIVTIGCGLLLAAVTTSVWFNQQRTNAALGALEVQMNSISASLASRNPALSSSSDGFSAAQPDGTVLISGTPVSRAGPYVLPKTGLSLRRLLAASGTELKFVKRVDVRRDGLPTGAAPLFLTGEQLLDPQGPDIMLQQMDLVTVGESKP